MKDCTLKLRQTSLYAPFGREYLMIVSSLLKISDDEVKDVSAPRVHGSCAKYQGVSECVSASVC